MSIRINSFGGPIIWFFRKHFSYYTSKIALTAASIRYDKWIRQYISIFSKTEAEPIFINCMIETINRCNGSCAFCPAAKKSETRPFKKMSDEMYHGIINELHDMGWSGTLYLNINNEPLIDVRILDFAEYAKKRLPSVVIELITNGTLLTKDNIYGFVGKFDKITINDYSDKYALSDCHREIFREVRSNPEEFKNIEIVINRRYSEEILATRAGAAPNKSKKNNRITSPCIYPFTDLLVYPDGKAGMCCNDCKEITEFGDVAEDSLLEIWHSEGFKKLRNAMLTGNRTNYPFCKECDVVDAGGHERQIRRFINAAASGSNVI